jgi:HlyD family secretion protein
VLAVISNRDYEARVAEARAEVHVREAELDRIVNGSRTQEREEALASTREAEAVLNNAKAEMDRRNRLFQSGDISRSDAEQTQREYAVAKARLDEAKQHYAFVDAGARPDDKSRAEAALELSRAQLAEAESRLAKTVIRSPVTGIVLRRYRKTGESVTEGADSPVLTVADNSTVRVRVDVDESDIGRVQAGQKAYVTAQAYGDRKFWGHVFRIGKELGRKNVRTDDPTERIDTKVLETLVELDGHPDLPDGLRVDAFILTGSGQ